MASSSPRASSPSGWSSIRAGNCARVGLAALIAAATAALALLGFVVL